MSASYVPTVSPYPMDVPPPKVRGTYCFQCGSRASASASAYMTFSCTAISVEPMDGISPNLHGYIIGNVPPPKVRGDILFSVRIPGVGVSVGVGVTVSCVRDIS